MIFSNKKVSPWIMSPLLMGIILLCVYFIKGIYPFGNNTIAYYDMGQLYIPLYCHTWDFFHGQQGLFWDWYLGGGISFSDYISSYILSPFNVLFFFTNREKMMHTISFLLLLKIVFASFSMSFYINKKYTNMSAGWITVLGVIYASSGFFIQYYTNMFFLDFGSAFPILMLAIDKILKDRKRVLYIVLMSAFFALNMQMMFMVCVFVVVYIFVTLYKNGEGKKYILNIGINTLIALTISGIVWIPTCISMMQSSRMGESMVTYNNNLLYMLINLYFEQKLFMFYDLEVAISFLVIVILKKRIKISAIKRDILLFLFLLFPVFFECTNIVWHIGGYVCFPMRYAYILSFCTIMLLCKVIDNCAEDLGADNVIYNIIGLCIGTVCLLIEAYVLLPLYDYATIKVDVYKCYIIAFVVIFAMYFFMAILKVNKGIIFALLIFESCIGWFVMLAPNKAEEVPEFNSNYIWVCEYLNENVYGVDTLDDSRIARIRDESVSLSTNYPSVLKNSSMSSWVGGTNSNMLILFHKLGYSKKYIRIMDAGATAFSDAFFHISKYISFLHKNDVLKTTVQEVGDYAIKENNVIYPYGILVNENIIGWSYDSSNVFDYQNQLFDCIHESDFDLLSYCDLFGYKNDESQIDEEMYYSSYVVSLVGDSENLYLWSNASDLNMIIGVNGEVETIFDLQNPENDLYPAEFNNGILDLGIFSNEDITIELASNRPIMEDDIYIAAMDINLLQEKTQEQYKYEREITPTNNGLKYTVNNTDGYKYLLLPIGLQNKFWCKVNGKSVECEPCIEDALTLIPIEEGMNEISLVYIPRGLITGAIISVIGVLLLVLTWKKWDAILEVKWLQNVASVCFTMLFWAIIVCIYILPTIAEIVLRFIWNPFGI